MYLLTLLINNTKLQKLLIDCQIVSQHKMLIKFINIPQKTEARQKPDSVRNLQFRKLAEVQSNPDCDKHTGKL